VGTTRSTSSNCLQSRENRRSTERKHHFLPCNSKQVSNDEPSLQNQNYSTQVLLSQTIPRNSGEK